MGNSARIVGIIGVLVGLASGALTLATVAGTIGVPLFWVGILACVVGAFGALTVEGNGRRAGVILVVAALATAISVVMLLAAPFFLVAAFLCFRNARAAASAG